LTSTPWAGRLRNNHNDIALLEARFNSIKMPENIKIQIEQLKSGLQAINSSIRLLHKNKEISMPINRLCKTQAY